MSTLVPALKFNSACAAVPKAKAFLMFYSPPLCGISANTEFTIFQPQTQKAAIFKTSEECARYYHLPCNTKNQKEAETKRRPC